MPPSRQTRPDNQRLGVFGNSVGWVQKRPTPKLPRQMNQEPSDPNPPPRSLSTQRTEPPALCSRAAQTYRAMGRGGSFLSSEPAAAATPRFRPHAERPPPPPTRRPVSKKPTTGPPTKKQRGASTAAPTTATRKTPNPGLSSAPTKGCPFLALHIALSCCLPSHPHLRPGLSGGHVFQHLLELEGAQQHLRVVGMVGPGHEHHRLRLKGDRPNKKRRGPCGATSDGGKGKRVGSSGKRGGRRRIYILGTGHREVGRKISTHAEAGANSSRCKEPMHRVQCIERGGLEESRNGTGGKQTERGDSGRKNKPRLV